MATLLALLSSEEAQQRLAAGVTRERVAFELSRAWFDIVYLPGGQYLGGLKGDFSAEAAETFRDSFDPVEIRALERFHRFFELRVEMVGTEAIAERRIPIDERWRGIMKDAGYLLQDLEEDVSGFSARLPSDVTLDDLTHT